MTEMLHFLGWAALFVVGAIYLLAVAIVKLDSSSSEKWWEAWVFVPLVPIFYVKNNIGDIVGSSIVVAVLTFPIWIAFGYA